MPIKANISAAIRRINNVWRRTTLGWEKMNTVWAKIGANVPVIVHYGSIDLVISATTTEYNIRTEAGSPAYPTIINVTIDSGVTVGSTTTSNPAIDTGTGWPAGTIIKLVNNGTIVGKGGAGGDGADVTCPSTCGNAVAGSNGGDAINMQHDLTVTNNGIIGGGGGGGGGAGGAVGPSSNAGGGGAGGGGAGYTSTNGGTGGSVTSCGDPYPGSNGAAGSTSGGNGGDGFCTEFPADSGTFFGCGGAGGGAGVAGTDGLDALNYGGGGGGGGGYGAAGGAGGDANIIIGVVCETLGASGGAAGKAIEPNANTLTLIDNGNVYGATT